MPKSLEFFIHQIIQRHFQEQPVKISRFTAGICNEVFAVTLSTQEVVVRMNLDDSQMRGSDTYIPVFKAQGISVPTILFSDYTKSVVPYYYQIITRLPGKNIDDVIADLNHNQLSTIALEIANIFKKLAPLPTNGQFGFVYGDNSELYSSWTDVMNHMVNTICERGIKTGTLNTEWCQRAKALVKENTTYFDNVLSRFYYDDLSSKNIQIDNGKFSGIVDLDGVAYGDYLETIGRIYASWYGTEYGTFYSEKVMEACGITTKQRYIVVLYALLNRLQWLTENGIQFNQNTSTVVDWNKVAVDTKVAERLWKEYQELIHYD